MQDNISVLEVVYADVVKMEPGAYATGNAVRPYAAKSHPYLNRIAKIGKVDIFRMVTPYWAAEQVLRILRSQIPGIINMNGIDMYGGLGGDGLRLATLLNHVLSIERDTQRFNWYKQVANLFVECGILPSNNIEILNGDSIKYIQEIQNSDYNLLYSDPPWTGPNNDIDYYTSTTTPIGDMSIEQFLQEVQFKFQVAVFKLPVNNVINWPGVQRYIIDHPQKKKAWFSLHLVPLNG